MQLSHHLGLSLPITSAFRRVADAFATQCSVREKADRIRRNTLAVCVVDAYLQMMDIPTDIGSGDSWQPMMQILADVADLYLPGAGAISCRAVLADDETCYIPPEEWADRLGYVAVVLDEQHNMATLVGFVESADEQTQVPLSSFAPIESLIDWVQALQASAQSIAETEAAVKPETTINPETAVKTAATRLGRWVESQLGDLAGAGWLAIDQLLNPAELGFAFRAVGVIEPPIVDISRAKLLNLGIQFGQAVRVALVIRLARSAAGEEAVAQTHITLQVRPIAAADYLPEGLLLAVLDDEGNAIASATSRAIDNYIQLQISGESEEQFGVQVMLDGACFEERFII